MTRNDVLASSRPQTVYAAPMKRGSSRALVSLILAPSVALALAVALVTPAAALAAEGTSGYGQTPTTPASTTPATTTPATTTPATTTPATTTPTPSTGTLPSKESNKPKSATAPATTSGTPTATTPATKATTLPFTGFDLRWTIGIGLLLMGAGFSIVTVQRHHRRDSGR